MLEYKRIEIEFVWKYIRMDHNKCINRQAKLKKNRGDLQPDPNASNVGPGLTRCGTTAANPKSGRTPGAAQGCNYVLRTVPGRDAPPPNAALRPGLARCGPAHLRWGCS